MTKLTVVYRLPGMEAAAVRRAVAYRTNEHGAVTMDLYYPVDPGSQPLPAVVIVLGYPDVGVQTPFGCQFREMGMMISWAQLFAASGMVGVVYETREPAADAQAVLAYLQEHGAELGIDGTKIGVWSSSGNVPTALSVLMDGKAQCGVLSYGAMLDLDGATAVSRAAAQYHFANPCAGRRAEEMPPSTPLFIARAGQDQYGNDSLDAFVAAALRSNLPLTLMNHATGPHAFDLLEDSDASREVVQAILAFLRAKLLG